jgi:hypothetical protein
MVAVQGILPAFSGGTVVKVKLLPCNWPWRPMGI